jgi:hypothetical protein
VVSLGDAVLFASYSGMISISAAGVSVWSLTYFTETEWPDFEPTTMVSALVKRRLYVRYEVDGTSKVLIFNLLGDQSYLTELHIYADDIYADENNGKLYLAYGLDIYEFDPSDGYTMSQDWKSKEFVLAKPMNLGAAKVTFEQAIDATQAAAIAARIAAIEAANAAIIASGNAYGSYGRSRYARRRYAGSALTVPPTTPPANEVTFQLYAGGSLKATRTLTDNKTFKLPSGYKEDTCSVRVQSQCKIRSIELAETAQAIGRV